MTTKTKTASTAATNSEVVKQNAAEKQSSARGNKRQQMGRRGEDAACEFLVRRGMKIIDRNWKCGYGEADIIATEGKTLVFCEVRTKSNFGKGSPAESITYKKRERYYKLIHVYRSRTAIRHNSVRFDFIGIYVNKDRQKARLHYIRNAYGND